MKTKFKLPKRILSLVLAFVMVLGMLPMSSFTAFAAATPTAYDGVPVTPTKITSSNYHQFGLTDSNWSSYNGYYGIRNAKDLYGFAALVNGGSNSSNAVLLQDIVINSGTVTQSGSSAGTTYSWTPIGTTDNPFLGIFDGNGCTISGLYINVGSTGVGLFGVAGKYSSTVANIQIKNLVLSNSYIRGYRSVGGIAGLLKGNFVYISNCQIASDVTVAAAAYELGGIAGGFLDPVFLSSYAHNIKNCVVYGKVVSELVYGAVSTDPVVPASYQVGAITGTYQTGTNMKEFITVTNCYFISGCMVVQCDTGGYVYTCHPNFGKGGADYTLNSTGGCTILTSTSASHTCVSVTHKEVQATCQYPGLSEYAYCLICGKVTSGTKTATAVVDHSFTTANCTTPATCIYCGLTKGSNNTSNHAGTITKYVKVDEDYHYGVYSCCGVAESNTTHNYSDATCVAVQKCADCGATKGKTNASNHTGDTKVYSVNVSDRTKHDYKWKCCGLIISTTSHSFDSNHYCSTCGYTCEHLNTKNGICVDCGVSGIGYVNRYWDSANQVVVSSIAVASGATAITADTTTMNNGWYILESDITISSRITVTGTVNLILSDGCTLTASAGVNVSSGNTLNIYGQIAETGTLVAAINSDDAAIGGGKSQACGTITINSGTVKATNRDCAGIGGGYQAAGGTITINGGYVTATGYYGAGIGGGSNSGNGTGTVMINGGTVIASNTSTDNTFYGLYGAGIGGGYYGKGYTVIINGGNVKATSNKGNAIGAGNSGSGGSLKDSNGNSLSKNTFTINGATDGTLVTEVEGLTYGLTSVKTLDTNKLYFYLPSGSSVSSVTTVSEQRFEAKNSGDTTLYCVHAKTVDSICYHCGDYVGKEFTQPEMNSNGDYLIYTISDLYWFRNLVNGTLEDGTTGNPTANAILMNDLDISGAKILGIGSSTSPYAGTFDGGGHTLTVALDGGRYTAPFSYVNGAKIMNLTVEGTIKAFDMNAAGFISWISGGNVVLEKCISSVDIISGVNGDGTHGGLVGVVNAGSLTVNNCAFNGSVTGTNTTNCGGLVGWAAVTTKISNSYVAAQLNINSSAGNSNTFSRNPDKVTLNNCYYLNALQNTPNTAIQMTQAQFESGEVTYLLNGKKSYDSVAWKQTLEIDTYPQLIGDTVYAVSETCDESNITSYTSYSNNADDVIPHNFSEDGICSVCGAFEPAKYVNGVYEISNVGQLMWFANFVNAGNQSADAILMADIDLTGYAWTPIGVTAMGESVTDGYTGNFDGNGHVIRNVTFAAPTSAMAAGIFGTVQSGGTVKHLGVENLTFDNNSYDHRAGGIAGQLLAGSTISDCYLINSTVKASSRVVGGIVGMNKGTVKNCFTYNMTLAGASNRFGGISGDYTGGTLENCYTNHSALASSQTGTTTNCEAGVSAERFASGEIAYKLNGSTSDGSLIWYQTIETGSYPQFSGGTVYKVSCVDTAGDFYRNENENYETHDFVDDKCTRCGSLNLTADENGIYQIYTADDLKTFAEYVNSDNSTASARLMADIDMTAHGNVMIGTSSAKYSGTFDGNGKTLTVNLNSTEQYTAPFRYINGATIQNLTVDGTISTSKKFAAGLVACSEGASKIEKCMVAATINSSVSGDGTHGGLVAHVKSGSMTIDNCGFIGSITGSKTHSCGGFVGWADVATTISNSYVAGTFTTKIDSCYTFGRNPGNITVSNSYYKTAYGTNNSGATQKSADQFASGEVTYLLNGSKSDDSVVWKQTLETDTYPKLSGGTVYKVSCAENTMYSNENTSYETHSFENSICTHCGKFEPAVDNNGVYEIYNAGQLMWFAEYVNAGNQSADAILMADIDLAGYAWTTICETGLYYNAYGTDLGYSGTFDGNGHIIKNVTVTSSTTKDASCGLFGTVSGTIKNLGIENFTFVDGGKDIRAGAIVGQLITANGKVSNCYVNGTTITPGEHVTGGIAGCVYDGTVENCFVVNSNINGSSGRYGYIVGDSRGDNSTTDRPGTVKNCYTDNATIRGNNVGNVTNCATKTTEQFASGEVAYLLGDAWGQTLGTDSYPVIGGKTVYKLSCVGVVIDYFSNDNKDFETHDFVDDVCSHCGTYNITADENGVYLIYTADDLMVFAKLVNAGNTSANAKLMADIDLGGYDWKPIGTYSDSDRSANAAYAGTFDGNYHEIRNLSVKVETVHETGLFGRVNGGGTIKNLGVVNAKVENTQGVRAGVIAGEIHNSTVTNVYTVGDITVTTSNANGQAGGIAGECASTTLTNCYTTYGYLTANTTATANNCYYMADTANSASAGTNLPESAFTGGELTWKLNGSTSEGVWKQTLGTEAYPSFTGETVYYGYVSCDQMVYINTPASEEKIHSWLDATCTAPKTCTVCGTTEGDALGHEGGEATCAIGAICDRCGEEYGDLNPDAHTSFVAEYQWYPYDDGTCYVSATLYCADCGGYVDSSGGYAELTGTVEPTDCRNPGSKTYTITLTMNGEEYTESKAFEVKSDNHVGQWDNGFCTACGGYQTPEIDPGEYDDETWDDTYLIYNAGQLFWFANYVNNGNNGAAGKLMANIDLNPGYTFNADGTYTGGDAPRAWIPIGSGSRCYAGAFDGNGFTVSGAYTVSESSYVGLFGNTDYNYEIKNLGITNSYFAGADHVGGLAGYAYTYIYNCYVTDTVYVSGGYPTGALVGYSGVEIHNSYAMADSLVGRNYGTVANSYYLSSEDTDGIDGTTALTAEAFASGEVAYLLQSGIQGEDIYDETGEWIGTADPEQIWGQTIGEDAYPVLKGAKVYQVANCKGETAYSNTEESGIHTDADNSGRCDTCNCLMQPALLRMVSISLKGNIALNYYMLLSDEVLSDSTAYMQFTTADGEIVKIPVSEGVKYEYEGETYYVFSCAVDAKEMTDDVISQFFYEGGSTKEHTYNVQTYAKHILANYDDEATKNLITSMLNYGAASQTHFGYNTDNMANAELAAPDYSDVTIEGFDAIAGQGTELAKFYSASLILKSETTLRFFFTGAITATYNGQALEVKERGGLYYVDVVGISAKDLDENVTITISDGTNTADVTYNPMTYCAAVQNDTTGAFDQEMKDLVAALYLYNQAANTYFKEN